MAKKGCEVVLLLAFTAGGCLPNQVTEKITLCRMEADRFYEGYNTADVNNPRSQYIIACMAAKGYDFDVSSADCDSRRPLTTQPACYIPNNWLAWIVDKIHIHEH